MSRLIFTPEKYLQNGQKPHHQAPTISYKLKQREHIDYNKKEPIDFKKSFSMGKRLPTITLDDSNHSSSPEVADLPTIDDLNNEENYVVLKHGNPKGRSHSFNMSYSHEHEPNFDRDFGIEPDPKCDEIANDIISNVLKSAVKEFHELNATMIRGILEDIIRHACDGISIDQLNFLSDDSIKENENLEEADIDYLSSMSVIGSDESEEGRNLDEIPDVNATLDVTDEGRLTNDDQMMRKTFITEPDIEIYDTKLADKIMTENMLDDEDVVIAGEIPTSVKGKAMGEEIVKLRRNEKKFDSHVKTKREKARDFCCGARIEGGCNMF